MLLEFLEILLPELFIQFVIILIILNIKVKDNDYHTHKCSNGHEWSHRHNSTFAGAHICPYCNEEAIRNRRGNFAIIENNTRIIEDSPPVINPQPPIPKPPTPKPDWRH